MSTNDYKRKLNALEDSNWPAQARSGNINDNGNGDDHGIGSRNNKARKRYKRNPGQRRQPSPPPGLPLFGVDIPESRVHFVDTPARLEAVRTALDRSVLLAIDTETQPAFAVGEWHPTSLLQVATRCVRACGHGLQRINFML